MLGGRFKKKGSNKLQPISTASLPDIIFMLLFYFMVTTVMKEDDLMVKINAPKATEVKKIVDKALVSYIYIGKPMREEIYGSVPQIQLNDAFAEPEDIRQFVAAKRDAMNESDQSKMVVSLKVDGKTEMGIVTDIKQELRKASALKINYSTVKGDPLYNRRY